MGQSKDWLQPHDSEFLAVLRAVSIVVIVFGHVGGFWIYPPWSELLQVFVPIFFFISGAVSYSSYLKSTSTVSYVTRRIVGILIPYYGVCFLALLVYVASHTEFPPFSLSNLIKWMAIIPSNAIMPFPLGQVWFLHTLLVLFLVSPVLFFLHQKHSVAFALLLCCSVIASATQLIQNIGPLFIVAGNDLFKPLVHGIFFCVGFLVLDSPKWRSRYISSAIIGAMFLLCIVLVKTLGLNSDYAQHTIFPDLYYVSGSLGAIWLFLLLQSPTMRLYSALPRVTHVCTGFLFYHTFSIYLLHTFSIYFVEGVFGLVNPPEKTLSSGIIKFTLVLASTLMLAPMLTGSSNWVLRRVLSGLGQRTDSSFRQSKVLP